MGLISIVQQFVRLVRDGAYVASITHDPGNAAGTDADVYGPAGDDSPPLPGDFAVLGTSAGAGRVNAIGFFDTKNEGVAQPGESRRYARDPDGAVVASIWMKGDGTIIVTNGSGAIEMAPSGDVTINGVTIDTNGNIETPGDIEADGKVAAGLEVTAMAATLPIALSTHTHDDSMGGPTTPPLP